MWPTRPCPLRCCTVLFSERTDTLFKTNDHPPIRPWPGGLKSSKSYEFHDPPGPHVPLKRVFVFRTEVLTYLSMDGRQVWKLWPPIRPGNGGSINCQFFPVSFIFFQETSDWKEVVLRRFVWVPHNHETSICTTQPPSLEKTNCYILLQ